MSSGVAALEQAETANERTSKANEKLGRTLNESSQFTPF
jgi:hypothetical protein